MLKQIFLLNKKELSDSSFISNTYMSECYLLFIKKCESKYIIKIQNTGKLV